jgi:hypothetical protein
MPTSTFNHLAKRHKELSQLLQDIQSGLTDLNESQICAALVAICGDVSGKKMWNGLLAKFNSGCNPPDLISILEAVRIACLPSHLKGEKGVIGYFHEEAETLRRRAGMGYAPRGSELLPAI